MKEQEGFLDGKLEPRLAEAKARAVAPRHPGALVIGSDQIADCDGAHVGKPGTLDRAREQIGLRYPGE